MGQGGATADPLWCPLRHPLRRPLRHPLRTPVKPSPHLRRPVRCSLKGRLTGGEDKGRLSGRLRLVVGTLVGVLVGLLKGCLSGPAVECVVRVWGWGSPGRSGSVTSVAPRKVARLETSRDVMISDVLVGAKGGTTYEGKLGHEFLENCCLSSLLDLCRWAS